ADMPDAGPPVPDAAPDAGTPPLPDAGGDTVADAGPSADAGSDAVADAATPTDKRRIFVTSRLYGGNLGGLAGADQKCQTLADAEGLGGTYRAILSDSNVSAADRLAHATGDYVLVDRTTVIAHGWAGLLGTGVDLLHAIDMTETGAAAPTHTPPGCNGGTSSYVYTASDHFGRKICQNTASNPGGCCGDFTTTEGGAGWGDATQTMQGWIGQCAGGSCTSLASLYCVEQ